MSSRTLTAPSTAEPLEADDQKAVELMRGFLKVPGEARFLKPYWVALATIAMRSLYAKYRKTPTKRGFHDLLALP